MSRCTTSRIDDPDELSRRHHRAAVPQVCRPGVMSAAAVPVVATRERRGAAARRAIHPGRGTDCPFRRVQRGRHHSSSDGPWSQRRAGDRALHRRSTDAGASWSGPRRLGSGNARHADLAAAPDGALVAVWDEPDGAKAGLQTARSIDPGATWSAPQRIAAGPSATLPRIIATRQGVATFWIEGSPWKGGVLKINGRTLSGPATAAGG